MRKIIAFLLMVFVLAGGESPSLPYRAFQQGLNDDTLKNNCRNARDDQITFPTPIPYRKQDLWGFCVSRTKFVTPVVYDSVREFWDGRVAVKLNGFWGVIDTAGNDVIPPKYKKVSDAMDGIIIAGNIRTDEIFDYKGKRLSVLKGHFDYTGMEYLYRGILPVKRNGRWGFFNTRTGRFVLPVKYRVNDFFENIATITGYKNGAIDFTTGDTVIPLIYDKPLHFVSGLALVERRGKAGFIDKHGKVVVPLIYEIKKEAGEEPPDGTLDFSGGFARVELNHRYGYLTEKGTKLTELKYDNAEPFFRGFGMVQAGHLFNVVETNGVELFDFSRYEDITIFIAKYREEKNYFVYHDYQPVDTCRFDRSKYDEVREWRYGCYSVKKNGETGFVDYTGYEYFEE